MLKKNEMIDWILSFQSTDEASTKHAIDRWKQTHSSVWLLAAIAGVDWDDQNANALIAAARVQTNLPLQNGHSTITLTDSREGKTRKLRVKAALDKSSFRTSFRSSCWFHSTLSKHFRVAPSSR